MKIIVLRKAVEDDYNFCHDLAKDNMYDSVCKHWGSWNSDMYKESFSIIDTSIVMMGKFPIGFFRVVPEEDHAFILDMQLKKEFQGRGFGKEILKHIESEAKKRGLSKIKLSVFADNLAKNLYEKIGFKLIEDKGFNLSYEKIL